MRASTASLLAFFGLDSFAKARTMHVSTSRFASHWSEEKPGQFEEFHGPKTPWQLESECDGCRDDAFCSDYKIGFACECDKCIDGPERCKSAENYTRVPHTCGNVPFDHPAWSAYLSSI